MPDIDSALHIEIGDSGELLFFAVGFDASEGLLQFQYTVRDTPQSMSTQHEPQMVPGRGTPISLILAFDLANALGVRPQGVRCIEVPSICDPLSVFAIHRALRQMKPDDLLGEIAFEVPLLRFLRNMITQGGFKVRRVGVECRRKGKVSVRDLIRFWGALDLPQGRLPKPEEFGLTLTDKVETGFAIRVEVGQ